MANKVLLEKTNAEEQRTAWKAPVDGWGKTGRASKLSDRMHDAYVTASWSDEQLDTIGAAMRLWNGVGPRASTRALLAESEAKVAALEHEAAVKEKATQKFNLQTCTQSHQPTPILTPDSASPLDRRSSLLDD